MATLELSTGLALAPGGSRTDSAYAWAYENVLFPAWQKWVHGRSIFRRWSQLESSQWLPHDEIAKRRLIDLRALLTYAGENVPYYGEIFAAHDFDPRGMRSLRDLQALPLLTRDIVRERYEDLIDPAHRGRNIKKGTSGTTGAPTKFQYCNDSESWRQATRLRGYRWAGYRQGLPTLHYWGVGSAPRGLSAAKIGLDRALRRERYVDAAEQDIASLEHAVEVVRRMRPCVIIGYTQATAQLARFVNDRNLRDWPDIPVICGAEAVLENDEAAIARAFGPTFETYGSRETMLIAAECHAHDGMHLSEENLFVEIVSDGQEVPVGESGDVVITDLHNYGFPLIRYVNGDVAAMYPATRCICGRGLRRLARVEGRRAEMLRDAHGNAVPGMLIAALFANREEIVKQFQVVQRANGKVVLKVVRGKEWSEPRLNEIVERLHRVLAMPITMQICEDIPAGASGKRRFVVVEPPDTTGLQ